MTKRQELFGTDLQLRNAAGGMDLAKAGPTANAGDIALAFGNTNIVQALTLALRVHKGELASLGWPNYGSRLHELIGQPNIPRTHLKAQAYALEALLADPRVLEVLALDVVNIPGERNVLRLAITLQLIDQNNPLNLVYNLALEGA